MIPVGIHTQETIEEDGEMKIKKRTTHDATFPPPSTKSINNRLIRELLTECFYGHCLLRVLHNIHVMRLRHPSIRILVMKLDLDAAYRRVHVMVRMALLAITIVEKIAYVLLRLPFGVANGPNDYSLLSEPIFDMTNNILQNEYYDPDELYSPLRSKLDEPEKLFGEETPFGVA